MLRHLVAHVLLCYLLIFSLFILHGRDAELADANARLRACVHKLEGAASPSPPPLVDSWSGFIKEKEAQLRSLDFGELYGEWRAAARRSRVQGT